MQWERNFGGSGEDAGYALQRTKDGGYIIVGETYSFGNKSQVYLIKTDASGYTQWERNLGGSEYDYGCSILKTSDGGYIIAGSTFSFGNASQVYLVKTDATGKKQWQRNFGGSEGDFGAAIQKTSDGGYIIVGTTSSFGIFSQVYLVKTDATGKKQWEKDLGGSDSDAGGSILKTSDGGYIIGGTTSSFGSDRQVYLVKTDATGKKRWQRNFVGSESDLGVAIQKTSDGGYIIAGSTFSFGNASQVYLVKTDATGNKQWENDLGRSDYDAGSAILKTSDGGYLIVGETHSFGNSNQVYVVKTDANGL